MISFYIKNRFVLYLWKRKGKAIKKNNHSLSIFESKLYNYRRLTFAFEYCLFSFTRLLIKRG